VLNNKGYTINAFSIVVNTSKVATLAKLEL
jgi:hypothetical protein